MRILVLSDAHGRFAPLEQAISAQAEAKTVLFLGDGERCFEELAPLFPDRMFISVAGNCDFGSVSPAVRVLTLGGVTVYMTHGHLQSVKSGLAELERSARAAGAQLALFGHTHVALARYADGLHLLNPGSVARPATGHASYGFVDITPAGIVTQIVEL